MPDELKPGPCPWCQSDRVVREDAEYGTYHKCQCCMARGPMVDPYLAQRSLGKWNRASQIAADLKASREIQWAEKQILITEIEKNTRLAEVNRELVEALEPFAALSPTLGPVQNVGKGTLIAGSYTLQQWMDTTAALARAKGEA